MLKCRLRHIEVAIDVRAECLVELLVRDVFNRLLMLLKSGVIYKDVEAPEFFECFRDSTLAELRIFYIARYRQTLSAFVLDRGRGLLCVHLLRGQMDDRHVGTL